MKRTKHVYMMFLGYLLYLVTFKIFPSISSDSRFFSWALPYIGYQGYHLGRWWQCPEGDEV